MTKEREMGYRIVKEDTPDDPREVAKGFGATELVDLDDAPEPEFGKPGTKSAFATKNLPRQFSDPNSPKVDDGTKDDHTKIVTNVNPELEPVRIETRTSGNTAAAEYSDPPKELEGFERLDLVSGPVPYLHLPEFKNGVFVRALNPLDAARISKAVRARSLTSLFDALSYTVNVPYRYLTIPDHYQIMYWHMINSYPAEPYTASWNSMYVPNPVSTSVRKPILSEKKLSITEKEFRGILEKGLDIPRVMSMDMYDTVRSIPVEIEDAKNPVEAAKAKASNDDRDNMIYLLEYMQFINIQDKEVLKFIVKHKDSAMPRIRGMVDYLQSQKNLNLFKEVKQLQERFDYGITESFMARAAPELPAYETWKYMRQLTPTEKIKSEIERIGAIIDKSYSQPWRKFAQDAPISEELANIKFTPEEEETTADRPPWAFFSYV